METRKIVDEIITRKRQSEEFCRKSSQKMKNPLIKTLLEKIAADKANYIKKIEELYGIYLDTGFWEVEKFGKPESSQDKIDSLMDEVKLSEIPKFSPEDLKIFDMIKELEIEEYEYYEKKLKEIKKEEDKIIFNYISREHFNQIEILKNIKVYFKNN